MPTAPTSTSASPTPRCATARTRCATSSPPTSARIVARPRRGRRAGHRGHPRRRPRRLLVQLRLRADARAGADRTAVGDRASRRRSRSCCCPASASSTTSGGGRQRRLGLPHRHALHRGRHLRQHFGLARELGLETVGFLMMAHSQPPEAWPRRPGSWPTPAASASTWSTRRAPCPGRGQRPGGGAGRRARRPTPRSASTATRTSASAWPTRCWPPGPAPLQIDGCTRGFGAGAGNTPVEAFAAVSDGSGSRPASTSSDRRRGRGRRRAGHGRRVPARPDVPHHGVRGRLLQLPQARRLQAARTASPAPRSCCAPARRLVGGQEDQLIEIAAGLAQRK